MGFGISLSSLFVVVFAAIPLVASGNARAQAPQYTIETIALTGDVAPGRPGTTFASIFREPVLNENGGVVFEGRLDSGLRDTGIWTGRVGNISEVALRGTEPPGVATGQIFQNFLEPILNDSDDVAFLGFIGPSGGDSFDSSGIFMWRAGSLDPVALRGQVAPGTAGDVFLEFRRSRVSGFFGPIINNTGDMVFRAFLDTVSERDDGIWFKNSGGLTLIGREGDVAPASGGEIFGPITQVRLNDSGDIAFRASIEPRIANSGLWLGRPGSFLPVAITGEVAPETGGRTFGSSMGGLDLNSLGNVAFTASLDGDLADGEGIWTGNATGLKLIVRRGDEAPGTSGRTFFSFGVADFNDSGDLAFFSSLDASDASDDESFWVAQSDGSLVLVAREGETAPGTGGRTFERLISTTPILSQSGEVAFGARLVSSDPLNEFGIWVGPPGAVDLLIRKGDLLEVAPGDFRTVSFVNILGDNAASPRPDGPRSGLNALGQLAFLAQFEDGSEGMFLASRLAARDDLVSLPKGKSTTIDVLANDMDPYGAGLSVLSTGPASDGTVILNPDDTVTYSRNGNFKNGCDKFTYTIQDGRGLTDQGLVQVAVGSGTCGPGPGNSPPVADDQAVSTPEDTPVAITLTASDADGDALTFAIVTGPTDGAVSGTAPDVTYTPNAGFTGTDSFSFKANDGTVDSNIATVTIEVAAAPGPTGTLKGTVKKDGKRISGASVRLDPGTASERQVTTNKAGKYGFDSVPAGIHTFTATDGVCGVGPFAILVTAGQTLSLDLFLVCP